MGDSSEACSARVEQLHEFNPMLGHRGCRLGITFPEINEMQARAIFEAALRGEGGGPRPRPEIMIPLVGTVQELNQQAGVIRAARDRCSRAWGPACPG